MGVIRSGFQPFRVVGAVDEADPTGLQAADGSTALDTKGDTDAIFTVTLSGTSPSVTLQPIWWSEKRQLWFRDPNQAVTYDAAGQYLFSVPGYAGHVHLLVTAISGTDAEAVIDVATARARTFT